jgi:hypothetical protein
MKLMNPDLDPDPTYGKLFKIILKVKVRKTTILQYCMTYDLTYKIFTYSTFQIEKSLKRFLALFL